MQRHANGNYIAATKNVAFKMKSASTVGSKFRRSLSSKVAYVDHARYTDYDYSFIYSFMLDGSISVEVMASGCKFFRSIEHIRRYELRNCFSDVTLPVQTSSLPTMRKMASMGTRSSELLLFLARKGLLLTPRAPQRRTLWLDARPRTQLEGRP